MRRSRSPALVALPAVAGAALLLTGARAAQPPAPPQLTWPVACRVGVDCEIQHYLDHDPAPMSARDQTCGARTYDGHDGVDIRLPDMAAQRRGVAVLAAADGKVLRVRDGVADVSVVAPGAASVKDIECGNGLVVDHGGGFEAQYCHMAKGSLSVRPGETVKAGQALGRVGLSGDTEFPHLHFTLRKDGVVVDPFAYGAPITACQAGGEGRSLWRQTPPYLTRAILNAGFVDAAPSMASIEEGGLAVPTPAAGLVVGYVRAIGLKAGDVQEMVLRGPDGAVLAQNRADPLPRNQDQRMMFIGKRRPQQGGWPKGVYRLSYSVTGADGKPALQRELTLTL